MTKTVKTTGKEMTTATETETEVDVRSKVELQPPRQFKVIYLNDEITTMEFVLESLMTVFDHSQDSAMDLMRKVHEDGSAVVAVLPYEIAEHKSVEVTLQARASGYPLQVKMEPDV
jgi:ATP-dependent Clp protease adaptor protein ClpS